MGETDSAERAGRDSEGLNSQVLQCGADQRGEKKSTLIFSKPQNLINVMFGTDSL